MKIKSLIIAVSMLGLANVALADDMTSSSMDAQAAVSQMNQLDGFINSAGADWTKYVAVHGGLLVDGHWGNLDQTVTGTSNERENVTAGYVAVEATPNDWAQFNTVINYNNQNTQYAAGQDTGTFVDQAYLTIANFDKTPLYFQAGQQYLPFGNYDLYPVAKPFTQLMSETNATDAQIGFVASNGLYGSVYTFQGTLPENSASGDTADSYGGLLGIKRDFSGRSMNVEVSFINNLLETDLISSQISNNAGFYENRVGAYALSGQFNAGNLHFKGRMVSAADSTTDITSSANDDKSKPSTNSYKVSYDVDMKGNASEVFFGYDSSTEAAALDIPETRYSAGINVFPWDNTVFGVEFDRNTNFGDGNLDSAGATPNGEDYYSIGLRGGVQF
jgi:hypothetical protein